MIASRIRLTSRRSPVRARDRPLVKGPVNAAIPLATCSGRGRRTRGREGQRRPCRCLTLPYARTGAQSRTPVPHYPLSGRSRSMSPPDHLADRPIPVNMSHTDHLADLRCGHRPARRPRVQLDGLAGVGVDRATSAVRLGREPSHRGTQAGLKPCQRSESATTSCSRRCQRPFAGGFQRFRRVTPPPSMTSTPGAGHCSSATHGRQTPPGGRSCHRRRLRLSVWSAGNAGDMSPPSSAVGRSSSPTMNLSERSG